MTSRRYLLEALLASLSSETNYIAVTNEDEYESIVRLQWTSNDYGSNVTQTVPGIYFSKNNGRTWTELATGYSSSNCTLLPGETVLFKRDLTTAISGSYDAYWYLNFSNDGFTSGDEEYYTLISISGNVTSLFSDPDDNSITIPQYGSARLFNYCKIKDFSLVFNSTSLSNYCYRQFIDFGDYRYLVEPISLTINATVIPTDALNCAFQQKNITTTVDGTSTTTQGTSIPQTITIDVSNAVEVASGGLAVFYGVTASSNTNKILNITFGKNLTTLNSNWNYATPIKDGATQIVSSARPDLINATFLHSPTDTASADIANVVYVGNSKGAKTTNIYTDNTAIKDMCIAKRDDYTIVHVYHLDGTDWDV